MQDHLVESDQFAKTPVQKILTSEDDNPNEEKSSYRQIFKATSLFGGVQVFQILVGIVRVKFVAILLGTVGVGIIGLLNSPIDLIISITGLGIAFSAVRNISEVHGTGDQSKIATAIITLRRWSWLTGMLGALVTMVLAPKLSQWSFGNKEYTWAFKWLSITVLLYAIRQGQRAILQGTRRLKHMAKAGVIGSALGLFTSIPLYYWYGIKGIVPALIISSITGLLLTWYFSRKVEVEKIKLSFRETYTSGLSIAKLGISMTIAGFIASFSRYVLNAFISKYGSVDQVGLYNAGWGVVGQYTNLVFAAMATDYFPRLSAIQAYNNKIKELVSQQAETALLIMTPMLSLLIVMMPLVVRLLYTPAFLPVVMFASLTLLGMQFKAVSWAMGYVFLAKGNGQLFLIMEVISGFVILTLNLLFYYLFGLNGLGISFILSYIFGVLFAYAVLKRKYDLGFSKKFYGMFLLNNCIVVFSFSTIFIPNIIARYAAGAVFILLAILFSLIKLNELMDIKSLIKSKFKK